MTKSTKLTNATGAPVADNTNIRTAGPRGPASLEDVWRMEKLGYWRRRRASDGTLWVNIPAMTISICRGYLQDVGSSQKTVT